MKRFLLVLIMSGLVFWSEKNLWAFAMTNAGAGISYPPNVTVSDVRYNWDEPVPQSSYYEVVYPAAPATPIWRARGKAENTGTLGGSASTSSTASSWNSAGGGGYIVDNLFINLSNQVPTADGVAILVHLNGSMSINTDTYQWAFARFEIRINEYYGTGRELSKGVLRLQQSGLTAPSVDEVGIPFDNVIRNPINSGFYPINQPGTTFNINAPLYLIMKGVSPSAFLNGYTIKISIHCSVYNGPGHSSFYDTVTFDPVRPLFLYSSDTNNIIYLPEGSTYNSSAGMGIPSTPTEPVAPTPPTPNPMTWEIVPFAASPTSISMTAATASHPECSPVYYNSEFMGSPTGGTGGQHFDWQESPVFVNTGLQSNHQYGYRVAAAACPVYYQDTVESETRYAYTLAENPTPALFSNKTSTNIRANWNANGNPAWTEYKCENTTNNTDSGWITTTYWDSTGLTPGATYHFQVKARNGDGIETTTWVDLGNQTTPTTISLYLPLILK
jgi:hypothetical protein